MVTQHSKMHKNAIQPKARKLHRCCARSRKGVSRVPCPVSRVPCPVRIQKPQEDNIGSICLIIGESSVSESHPAHNRSTECFDSLEITCSIVKQWEATLYIYRPTHQLARKGRCNNRASTTLRRRGLAGCLPGQSSPL